MGEFEETLSKALVTSIRTAVVMIVFVLCSVYVFSYGSRLELNFGLSLLVGSAACLLLSRKGRYHSQSTLPTAPLMVNQNGPFLQLF